MLDLVVSIEVQKALSSPPCSFFGLVVEFYCFWLVRFYGLLDFVECSADPLFFCGDCVLRILLYLRVDPCFLNLLTLSDWQSLIFYIAPLWVVLDLLCLCFLDEWFVSSLIFLLVDLLSLLFCMRSSSWVHQHWFSHEMWLFCVFWVF